MPRPANENEVEQLRDAMTEEKQYDQPAEKKRREREYSVFEGAIARARPGQGRQEAKEDEGRNAQQPIDKNGQQGAGAATMRRLVDIDAAHDVASSRSRKEGGEERPHSHDPDRLPHMEDQALRAQQKMPA